MCHDRPHRPARIASSFCLLALFAAQTRAADQKLLLPGAQPNDELGQAVDVDGDVLVAGAPFADDLGSRSGSVAVFERVGDTWSFVQKLTASDGATGHEFGSSVAVKRDLIAVGAPTALDSSGAASGAVYLFRRQASGWVDEIKLTGEAATQPNILPGASFGYAVDIEIAVPADSTSGEELTDIVVGVPFYDNGDGALMLFELSPDGQQWNQIGNFQDEDTTADGGLGLAVAMSGDLILGGAPEDDQVAANGGAAYLFRRTGSLNAWSQFDRLTASDAMVSAKFGHSVALDGGVAVVGAPFSPNGFSGAAYIYEGFVTAPTEQIIHALDAEQSDEFGTYVAVSALAQELAIGAPHDDDDGASSGSVYRMTRGAAGWSHAGKIRASDAAGGDEYGTTVAYSTTALAIGAPFDDLPPTAGVDRGAVYVTGTSGIFVDGFERGDASAWSAAVP